MSKALFSREIRDKTTLICLICNLVIPKKAKKQNLGEKSWS